MNPPISDPNPSQLGSTENPAPLPSRARSTRWGWGLILLWVYSLVVMGAAVIGSFLPYPSPPSPQQGAQDAIIGGIALLPVVLFIVLLGVRNFRQ